MMTKEKTILMCLLFGLSATLRVQGQINFEVPQNVELNAKDDYAKYETDMINAAKWLEETDLNKEADKRQQVNAFVLKWITGSPTVNVEISKQLGKIYDNNIQLLGIYLASYARNYLENKSTATTFSATKAGLLSMMNVYKKGIEISKSKEMEKVIKLADENKLDEYINDKLM